MRPQHFILLLLLSVTAACSSIRGDAYTPTFTVSEHSLFPISEEQAYTFGYLEVPENRADPGSRTIKLPVYIFQSRNPTPQPDPVIYTVGGPGSTTMPAARYMKYYRYLDERDLILFEQRGNYYAQPHLDCPEWAEAVYRSNLPGVGKQQSDSLLAVAAAACRERLADSGIDLNGYTTKESAADIADLRKALGFNQYNLLTISYSTKIAQVLLRDYPEGIRSVVMDSPLPLEVSYDEESLANLLEGVEKILSDCASDAVCKAAFPDIKDRFFAYLRRITEQPLAVEVENPGTGKQATFYLSGKDVIAVLASPATGDVPAVPLEIQKLLNGDLSSVRERLAGLFEGADDGAGIGVRLSVWCAEEYPFNSQEVIVRETNAYPETSGLSPAVFSSAVCEIWHVEPADKLENKAVKSDIPVLLISGGYDPDTPPKWAAAMQKNLSNSYHLIFEGWAHTPTTNWSDPCAMNVANAFFNDPSQEPLLDCFRQMKAVRFKK